MFGKTTAVVRDNRNAKQFFFAGSIGTASRESSRAVLYLRHSLVLWNVVARDGIEPPTPAFSEPDQSVATTT
jgi:hypothetical protein